MPRVKDEMVREPVAATVPATRRELLALFRSRGHAGFPVVKGDTRKLVGVVTRQHVFEQPDEAQVALLMDPNPPTTYPEAPLREAARLVVQHRLRVLPVVNGANDLVGLLSPRELLTGIPIPNGHVASLLSRRLVPVHQATPTNVALEVLRVTRATALPLLDDDGRFAGLVTDGDILAHMRVAETTVRSVAGLAAESDAWRWEGLREERSVRHGSRSLELPNVPVASIARRNVETLGPNAALQEAVDLFLGGAVHHVPIVADEGHIIDLLSESDVLAALLPAPPPR